MQHIRDLRNWRSWRIPFMDRVSTTQVLLIAYAALLIGFVIVVFAVWNEG